MAQSTLADIESARFDVAIIGGGINGACLFHQLTHAGYRVLLADRGDFACGTSQASTMMIWGGLLYLKDWELRTVWSLCGSRNQLIREHPAAIRPRTIRLVPVPGGRRRALVQAALYAYWLLGRMRRPRPHFDRNFTERAMLAAGGTAGPADIKGTLTYEEASLQVSDAHFVLSWILQGDRHRESVAHNYCEIADAHYDAQRADWQLDLRDPLHGTSHHARARLVVNAAGGWTDQLNARTGIDTPFRHVHSRGVSIALPRHPAHETHLIFENGIAGNAMTYAPWGPVSLWGSTDTLHATLDEARRIEPTDIDFLLAQLNRHLANPVTRRDIVSLRCGVRPIAVPRNMRVGTHAQSLSRHHHVHVARDRPWISVYGGKLSGCTTIARAVAERVGHVIGAPAHRPAPQAPAVDDAPPPVTRFPGLDRPVVCPTWAATQQACRTLDDYLRRRTNIAQWVRRGGLGAHDEHRPHLHTIANAIHRNTTDAARDVERYLARVTADARLLEGDTL